MEQGSGQVPGPVKMEGPDFSGFGTMDRKFERLKLATVSQFSALPEHHPRLTPNFTIPGKDLT